MLLQIKKALILGSCTFFSTALLAVEVPLSSLNDGENPNLPSSDLIYDGPTINVNGLTIKKGSLLSSENASILKENKIVKDLSYLNPASTPEWENKLLKIDNGKFKRLDKVLDDPKLPVESGDTLHFNTGFTWIQGLDFADFQVKNKQNKKFLIRFGRNLHNNLLNKALMRKLGYTIPPNKWLKTIKIKFENTFSLKQFIKDLRTNIGGYNPRRWIVNIEKQPKMGHKINPDRPVEEGYSATENGFLKDSKGQLFDAKKQAINSEGHLIDANGEPLVQWAPISGDDFDNKTLVLQDVIIKNSQDAIFDYSNGALNPQMPMHKVDKRIYKSLLAVYHLNDINESVNKLSTVGGRVRSGNIFLDYKYGVAHEDLFTLGLTPDEDDMAWMVRRIAHLSREDFKDIVKQGHYPDSVELILIEKLIERRNWFVKVFLSKKPECKDKAYYCKEIPTDLNKNLPPHLVSGTLTIAAAKADSPADTKNWWTGYATKFSFGAEESPIVIRELKGLLRIKAVSNVLADFITRVNKDIKTSDMTEEYIKHQNELLQKQIRKFLDTNQFEKVPFGFWAYPTAKGQLISSRDVIFGNYLGTENNIQVARTAGFAVDAGAHIGTHGTPSGVFAAGEATMSYTKTFTHIKPIYSMEAAFKQHFNPISLLKHILLKDKSDVQSEFLINLINDEYAKHLDPILAIDPNELDNELKMKNGSPQKTALMTALKSAIKPLKDNLNIGESLIISDHYGPKFNFSVGKGIRKNLDVSLKFHSQLKSLSRIQITRSKEDEIQIYITPGLVDIFGLGFDMNTYIRLFSVGWTRQSSRDLKIFDHLPKTHFYKIDLNPGKIQVVNRPGSETIYIHDNFVARKDFVDEIQVLRNIFRSDDSDYIKETLNAYKSATTVSHDFTETSINGNLLFWDGLKVNVNDKIQVKLPFDITPKEYFRVSSGLRTGKNYQKLLFNVVNSILKNETESEITLNDGSNGNPGDTIKGHSRFRNMSFEAKGDKNINHHQSLKDTFAQIHYRWKGWNLNNEKTKDKTYLKKSDLEEVLNEINEKFKNKNQFQLVNPSLFYETKNLELFNIDVFTYIYELGIEHLARLGHDSSKFSTEYTDYSFDKAKIRNSEVRKKYKLDRMAIPIPKGYTKVNGLTNVYTFDINYAQWNEATGKKDLVPQLPNNVRYKNVLEYIFDNYSHASKYQSGYNRGQLQELNSSPVRAMLEKFKKYQKKYLGHLNGSNGYKKDAQKSAEAGAHLVNIAESQFPLDLFIEMVGGESNMYTYPIIQGFRDGDESSGFKRADKPNLLGNGIGHIGREKIRGPLQNIIHKTKMSESAFLLNWLLRRL